MKAQISNLVDTKKNEVNIASGTIYNRMEAHVEELRRILHVMVDTVEDARKGMIPSEEAARRYLMNMNVLITAAVDNDFASDIAKQMKRKEELNKLTQLEQSW